MSQGTEFPIGALLVRSLLEHKRLGFTEEEPLSPSQISSQPVISKAVKAVGPLSACSVSKDLLKLMVENLDFFPANQHYSKYDRVSMFLSFISSKIEE